MIPSRRGFVLLSATVSLVVLLAFAGLATDVGRLTLARNELQAFADEAAVAAGFELDGTSNGLARARAAGQAGPGNPPNRWEFGTQAVPAPEVGFAQAAAGPFEATPAGAGGYRYVRVRLSASVPVYFLPVIPGVQNRSTVSASAVAGQITQTSLGDGLSPFSPDAHNAADPDFGFTRGTLYTLRWPPPGQRDTGCAGDNGFAPLNASQDRGYLDFGQGKGATALADVVLYNSYYLLQPLTIGSPMPHMVPGEKDIAGAVNTRFNQDTDTSSAAYAGYHGNGRRVLIVPVNDHMASSHVSGFAAFFLPPSACGTQNTHPCCAEYIGPAVLGGPYSGAAEHGGLFTVKLVQ